MKNTDRLNIDLIAYLKYDLNKTEDEINKMSNNELFSAWLDYEGFYNYFYQITGAIENIYDIKLENDN